MTTEEVRSFLNRIDQLTPDKKAKFGKMNVHQMVCHCADQIRLALGTLRADDDYIKIDPDTVKAMARAKETVPTPKGLDQVAGGGTPPTTFENDRALLKNQLHEFLKMPEDIDYPPHPYFGAFDKKRWINLTRYHLNHHLSQFYV